MIVNVIFLIYIIIQINFVIHVRKSLNKLKFKSNNYNYNEFIIFYILLKIIIFII